MWNVGNKVVQELARIFNSFRYTVSYIIAFQAPIKMEMEVWKAIIEKAETSQNTIDTLV